MISFELNTQTEFESCSGECAKLFGVDARNIHRRRLDQFIDLHSGSRMLDALYNAYETRPVHRVPVTIIGEDGKKHPMLLSLTPHVRKSDDAVTGLKGSLEHAT